MQKYIRANNLDRLINFRENTNYRESVFDAVSGKLKIPIPPNAVDLVRLHRLIRQRMSFTVLEFGVGYSTVVIADALRKNEADWQKIKPKPPAIRNHYMFQLFSVDSSAKWFKHIKDNFPKNLLSRVHLSYSPVQISTWNGRLCHFYKRLPDIVPDFIYLDGPAPKDVQGKIKGLSFHCDERTVMSGDLLMMEPTFLPITFILVDGRTNNARFLKNNFQRDYAYHWDKIGDVSTFELIEPRLGKYNLLGSDFIKINKQ